LSLAVSAASTVVAFASKMSYIRSAFEGRNIGLALKEKAIPKGSIAMFDDQNTLIQHLLPAAANTSLRQEDRWKMDVTTGKAKGISS
jgi:hypothetical protein